LLPHRGNGMGYTDHMNKEISDYIKKSKESGMDERKIAESLIVTNHKKEDVYNAYKYLIKEESYIFGSEKDYFWEGLMSAFLFRKQFSILRARGMIYPPDQENKIVKILLVLIILLVFGLMIYRFVRLF